MVSMNLENTAHLTWDLLKTETKDNKNIYRTQALDRCFHLCGFHIFPKINLRNGYLYYEGEAVEAQKC
jgi:hypothetical protein